MFLARSAHLSYAVVHAVLDKVLCCRPGTMLTRVESCTLAANRPAARGFCVRPRHTTGVNPDCR
jgi:hypothetical protein